MRQKLINFLIIFFVLAGSSVFGRINDNRQQTDWLINGETYISKVVLSANGKELLLTNGLIERRFRIDPNFACISVNNLVTEQNYLRSVRPEAQITVNGKSFDIGGLNGQPVHNYLLPEWVGKLTNNEEAFQFVRYSVENIKPRFDWKIRKEWIAGDVKWPAEGKELIVEYKSPTVVSKEVQREILFHDDFTKRSKGWELFASKSNERNSFFNEGKFGEIMADENVAVYVERKFPGTATAIQCLINPGTDQSSSWGPGLALVYTDKTIKFNLKPGKKCFGVWDGSGEREVGKLKDGADSYLRMTLYNNHVYCEASEDGRQWAELSKIYCPGQPQLFRMGKMDVHGAKTDARETGKIIRCQMKQLTVFGKVVPGSSGPSPANGLVIKVHYEIYDGLPLISKWITVHNQSDKMVVLNSFVSEILAAVEGESSVEGESDWELPNIHVETDYAFSAMSNRKSNRSVVHWEADPLYTSQVNYARVTPCLLKINPSIGPEQEINPGESFESIRAWELFYDSYDKERKGLATRKMYRTIAPWVTENPILMHVRNADPVSVKLAIDQCAEVGFEMVIMTFGSGFNMESGDSAYYRKMKELADYAHIKKIALGGYSLLASRAISEKDDVVNPETGKRGGIAYFGNSPCLGSEWGIEYFRKIKEMYEMTGMDIIEHDGSYPGDICASSSHPGHTGLNDSQWNQFKTITGFYRWCRSQGIYLNVPDWYYLNGSSKCAMGYREVNWSLPRAQQEIVERQNIYDGTWTKTPSMGWMFVPLTEYQGGGAAATIEPLSKHLAHYAQRLANLFGAGVQACYRGPRLYDTDSTKAVVKQWVDFYKEHRRVLDSDIIHLRRPDGIDWDGLLHVNPAGKEKGLLMIYNPLNEPITRTIHVPVYYTGLDGQVEISDFSGKSETLPVSRDYYINLKTAIPAHGYLWYILK
jgi:hypothetical protein